MTNEKNNRSLIIQQFLNELNKLAEAEHSLVNKLKADLVQALLLGGEENAAKRVLEEGLPSYIYVSSDIFKVCEITMSKYATIVENKLFDEPNMMLLSWYEIPEDSIRNLKMR
ncbi:MAG: hypothetical protein Q8T08_09575 [Ignavibacteria bacterium]|nr:hypothetical protein [Ignavibacteria bacterium]